MARNQQQQQPSFEGLRTARSDITTPANPPAATQPNANLPDYRPGAGTPETVPGYVPSEQLIPRIGPAQRYPAPTRGAHDTAQLPALPGYPAGRSAPGAGPGVPAPRANPV